MKSRWLKAVNTSTPQSRSSLMARAASKPSMPGILMSRMARSGRSDRASSTASSPRPVSPTISYPSSSRVSRRSRRMMASSSAISTRVGNMSPFRPLPFNHPGVVGRSAGEEPVEELVAAGLEAGDRLHHLGAAAAHGVGVAPGVTMLPVGERGLRDEGPEVGVVGVVTQMDELLVDDPELLSQRAQAVADLCQTTLDQGPVHEADHTDGWIARVGSRAGYASSMSDAWSIPAGFGATGGTWHPTPDAARRALLVAMDADERSAPPPPPPMQFLEAGS